jgi:two-component system response regulator CpxR
MVQLKNITNSSFDMTVLLIDDDEKLANGLKAFLKKFNIKVMLEHRIATAEKKLRRSSFDIILLDVMLPGGNGFDFLPKIREICDTPVIMLTALDGEEELINGLNLGADDYITKPFSATELVARLRAQNRRHSLIKEGPQTVLDDLELYRNQSMVRIGKKTINLTDVESQIMLLLLNAEDNYLSRDYLYNHALNRDMTLEDRSLDVHISNIRRKLGPHPNKGNRIIAKRGKGYVLTK